MPTSNLRLLVLLGLLVAGSVRGAELLYFFSPSCGVCRAFDQEVAGIYPRTDAGRAAPMRRVEVDPDTFRPLSPDVAYDPGSVPTFILVDSGREIARLSGYSGDELFWMSMQRMLDMLQE